MHLGNEIVRECIWVRERNKHENSAADQIESKAKNLSMHFRMRINFLGGSLTEHTK